MKLAPLLALCAFAGCKSPVSAWPACKILTDAGTLSAPQANGAGQLGDGGAPACFYDTATHATRTACAGPIRTACASDGKSAPNLSCLAAATADLGAPLDLAVAGDMTATDGGTTGAAPPTGRLQTVTLKGFVHVFDNGGNGDNVTVAIYNGAQLALGVDPSALVPLGSTLVTLYQTHTSPPPPAPQKPTPPPTPLLPWLACDRDVTQGCTLPLAGGCGGSCNDGLDGRRDDGKYCRDDGHAGVCSDRLRWEASFTQLGVPVGEPLVVRVNGAGGRADGSWTSVLQWNITVPPASQGRVCANSYDSACYDGADYRLNVTAMAQVDYSGLPQAAGLSGGLTVGHGMVLGELHDCDGVRLGNGEVAVTPAADLFSYFDDNVYKMTPDSRRSLTDPLGRFAAFNLLPGKVTLVGGGVPGGGAFTGFGSTSAYVFANSVTLVDIGSGF